MTPRPHRLRGGPINRFRAPFAVILAVLLAGGVASADRPADEEAGSGIELLDLDGRTADPLGPSGAAARVFLFTRTDCPISNRYAPEVRRLFESFTARGVEFRLVYPDPDETPERIREHLSSFGYPFGALRDPRHELVGLVKATITPEVAVFDREGKLVYVGRIDDRYVAFGRTRPAPTRRDLEEVLDATLANRPVPVARTPAVGCYISDLE